MPWRRSVIRIAVAETPWPSLRSSPSTRTYPRRGFSRARRTISAWRSAASGGRPGARRRPWAPPPLEQLAVPRRSVAGWTGSRCRSPGGRQRLAPRTRAGRRAARPSRSSAAWQRRRSGRSTSSSTSSVVSQRQRTSSRRKRGQTTPYTMESSLGPRDGADPLHDPPQRFRTEFATLHDGSPTLRADQVLRIPQPVGREGRRRSRRGRSGTAPARAGRPRRSCACAPQVTAATSGSGCGAASGPVAGRGPHHRTARRPRLVVRGVPIAHGGWRRSVHRAMAHPHRGHHAEDRQHRRADDSDEVCHGSRDDTRRSGVKPVPWPLAARRAHGPPRGGKRSARRSGACPSRWGGGSRVGVGRPSRRRRVPAGSSASMTLTGPARVRRLQPPPNRRARDTRDGISHNANHDNRSRPHRARGRQPPLGPAPPPPGASGPVRRRDRLGGLLHEYERVAA